MTILSTGRVTTQPLRIVAMMLYASVLIVEFIIRNLGWCGPGIHPPSLVIMLVLLSGMVVMEMLEQRYLVERPLLLIAVGALIVRMSLTQILSYYQCSGFYQFFALLPPLFAYLYIGRRAAYITTAINIGFFGYWMLPYKGQYSEFWLQEENILTELFIFLVGIMFMLVVGRMLSLEEKNRQRAEQLVVELEHTQRQNAELAKVDERNRIARDIHDSVGHHLTAVSIQLEKAIAFRPINADEADQALRDAKRSAQLALADVRDSVSALRDRERDFRLVTGLRALVENFGRFPITLHIEGDETPFAKSALIALYRAAQEGLTNMEKHAGATSADLRLSLQPNHAILTLQDNGVGVDLTELAEKSERGDAHFGLTGLRERLELVGGTLRVTSQKQQGTTLHVQVPAQGLT